MRRSRKLALAIAATATATLAITQASAAVAEPANASPRSSIAAQQPLTAQEAAALSQDANTPVIVVMRDQPAAAAKNTPAATTRAHNITSAQAPVATDRG